MPKRFIFGAQFFKKQYDTLSELLLEYDILFHTIACAHDPSTFEKDVNTLQNKCKNFYYRHCKDELKMQENTTTCQAQKSSFETLSKLCKKLKEDINALNCNLKVGDGVEGKKEEGVAQHDRKRRRTGSLDVPPVFAATLRVAEDNEAADEDETLKLPQNGRKFFLSYPPVASCFAVECPNPAVNVSMVDDVCLSVFCDAQLTHLLECSNEKGIRDCQSIGSPVFSPIFYAGNTINQRTMARKCNCCGAFIYAPTSSKTILEHEKKPENLQSISVVFAILMAGKLRLYNMIRRIYIYIYIYICMYIYSIYICVCVCTVCTCLPVCL